MAAKEIYMVAYANGRGYRKVPRSVMVKMRAAGIIRFEGVDGDEINNTVTYWYGKETI